MTRILVAGLMTFAAAIIWELSGLPQGPEIHLGPAILGIVFALYVFGVLGDKKSNRPKK